MELPVTGSPWPAAMPSSPLSKAATAAGTSLSVIWRNVTIGGRSGRRQEGGPPAFEIGDLVRVAQGEADVVPPVEQGLAGELVEREGAGQPGRRRLDRAPGHVDGELERRVPCHRVEQGAVKVLGDLDREKALLGGVVAEDVGEARRDDRLETEVRQGPDGVLAGGPRAEVVPRDQNSGPDELGFVEHEVPVVAPFGEEAGAEAGPLHPLEPVRGDDLVGVDVRAVEGHGASG